MNNKVELLAPGGDFAKAKTAIDFGADAIYLGGLQYSLRARASNFTLEDIAKISAYAHAKKRKWYLVINVLCHNHMVEGFDEYFKQMLVYRPDGFIVSDPFIISRINALAPKIPIHISTQQSVANSKSALFFHRNGAQRIILSREVSFAELKPLIKNVKNKLEIETFIHGAVCIGYSGRCVFSNNFCLRDSNIGGCAQCCRWVTSISDDKKTYSNHFSMSAKDMCLIKHIDQLVAAGVKSFKIEGRMKSEYYIACITNAYRNAIDKKYDLATARTHALKAANREVDIAWFDGKPNSKKMLYHEKQQLVKQNFAFIIKRKISSTEYEIVVKNNMKLSDKFEVLTQTNNEIIPLKIIKLTNQLNEQVTVLPSPNVSGKIKFAKPCSLVAGDIGRII